MSLVMTSPPGIEPVTVADAKAHMRIDHDAEDVLLASLVLTSRLHIETALSLALVTQSWMFMLDQWPQSPIVELPLAPLRSVTSVGIRNASGTIATVPDTAYLVDIASRPPRIIWNNAARPAPDVGANGIEIGLTVGFGDDAASVPAPLKHAILMLTAHWYEHRDPREIGSDEARIPDAVSNLINPFRTIRL